MSRVIVIFLLFASGLASANADYRQQPCKSAALARKCIQIHGRLSLGNGTPSTRLWRIGSHHTYGIYSNGYGFLHDDRTLDNEAPELHFTLPNDTPEHGGWTVCGDFEVCPLEPQVPGHMQAACVAGATHIVSPKE